MDISTEELIEGHDNQVVSATALKVFFNVAKAWRLDESESMVLLGDPGSVTLSELQNGGVRVLSMDTLERISYVLGIYKCLRTIFPTEQQACAWPKKANSYFGGRSALDVMLGGRLEDLADVRRFLEGSMV